MAYSVSDLMVQQAPQIGPMINQKIMARPTPWITLGRKETWSDEVSSVQKTFQFDRAKLVTAASTTGEFAEEVEWANVSGTLTASDDTANHIASITGSDGATDGLPPSDTVEFTQTLRDYRLQHKAVWGPPMNTNNLRDKFQRVKQMGACIDALADQGRELQINRARNEYYRIADNLCVLDSSFSLAGGAYGSMGFPAYSGSDASILTNGFTDIIYEYLNHQGAAEGALGQAGGSAGYSLITSPRQSRRLVMADPDVREDFRYSSQNEGLLAAMGKKWSYNGFVHTCDEKVNRWEYMASATMLATVANPVNAYTDAVMTTSITAVATALAAITDSQGALISNPPTRLYKGSQVTIGGVKHIVTGYLSATTYSVRLATGAAAASTGAAAVCTVWAAIPQFYVAAVNGVYKRIPNPGWLTATWEDTVFYHQGVCTTLVPKPITSVGQASFPATSYSGTYRWTNYEDRIINPDGSIGQFRGVWSNGTRPDSPEFGIVCRHLAVPRPDGRVMDASSLG